MAYFVAAFDNSGNKAVSRYFAYDVPAPWYVNTLVLGAITVAAVVAVAMVLLLLTRRRRKTH